MFQRLTMLYFETPGKVCRDLSGSALGKAQLRQQIPTLCAALLSVIEGMAFMKPEAWSYGNNIGRVYLTKVRDV